MQRRVALPSPLREGPESLYTAIMFNTIAFAASTVIPIFALIALGVFLKQSKIIGPEFIASGSKVVFKFALPAMVFMKMSQVTAVSDELMGAALILFAANLLIFLISWILSAKLPPRQHGSFVQGAFRGNTSIVGLAVIENSFGLEAMQAAVVILAVLMPVKNFLSIIVLSRSSSDEGGHVLKRVAVQVVKNPLIWAIALGLPVGLFQIPVPGVIIDSVGYLSRLTMPLALISIGGSLSLAGMKMRRLLWMSATVIKLLVMPVIVWFAALFFGITGPALAALVLSSACPTAVSSFAMADAMGADSELSGEIVSSTTLFSILTFTVWIMLLMGRV